MARSTTAGKTCVLQRAHLRLDCLEFRGCPQRKGDSRRLKRRTGPFVRNLAEVQPLAAMHAKPPQRRVGYGAFSAKPIERILAVQARPKTCWDRMAEEKPSHLGDLLTDDPTPPRPAAEYQHLLFEESKSDDQAEEKDDTEPEDQDEPF